MSDFLKLNGKDLFKGMLVAVLAIITSSLSVILDAGALPTAQEWLGIAKVAGTAAVSYLLKNLFTNSNDELLKPDSK
jgi:hypothetical protein